MAMVISANVGKIWNKNKLNNPLMESVPRSMTRKTSPVFLLKCHLKLRLCKCRNSSSCKNLISWVQIRIIAKTHAQNNDKPTFTSREVYCWTLIQKNDLRLFNNPILPLPPPWRNLNATKINTKSQRNTNGVEVKLSTEILHELLDEWKQREIFNR